MPKPVYLYLKAIQTIYQQLAVATWDFEWNSELGAQISFVAVTWAKFVIKKLFINQEKCGQIELDRAIGGVEQKLRGWEKFSAKFFSIDVIFDYGKYFSLKGI